MLAADNKNNIAWAEVRANAKPVSRVKSFVFISYHLPGQSSASDGIPDKNNLRLMRAIELDNRSMTGLPIIKLSFWFQQLTVAADRV
jgi:hypothetical protein